VNTKLELMYRDADNYKTYQTVILKGEISDLQIQTIKKNLIDDEFIVAEQVGLPTPSELFAKDFKFPTDSDHIYTVLVAFDDRTPNVESLLSEREATIELSINRFVEKISSVEWDELKEMDRLGIIQ